jgi:hypothetical protein
LLILKIALESEAFFRLNMLKKSFNHLAQGLKTYNSPALRLKLAELYNIMGDYKQGLSHMSRVESSLLSENK